jgi:hypothetical protein
LYGFSPVLGTFFETYLIHLHDFINGNTSKGLFTGMVMLDLQKAFKTVDHDILCKKLNTIGIKKY